MVIALALLCISASVIERDGSPELRALLVAPSRAAADRMRDQWRRPDWIIGALDLRADSKVLELWPGRGALTELIAPRLGTEGRYVAAGFDPQSDALGGRQLAQAQRAFENDLREQPERFGRVEVAVLAPPERIELGAAASYDRVLAVDVSHWWLRQGTFTVVMGAVFDVLRPGGLLVIVDYRADPRTAVDIQAKNGYVNEAYLIEQLVALGFAFDSSSDALANPRDSRNHPRGAWSLPPTLALGEVDRARYLAIGEPDRMLLRLRKPLPSIDAAP